MDDKVTIKNRKSVKITDAHELVSEIARISRERMFAQDLVNLSDAKTLETTPPSLLIIEDDDLMRRTLLRIFESEGYRVHCARDGVELSKMIDGISVDLVMVDVGLPWVNGFELVNLMKAHKDLKDVPVVFISGNSDRESIKTGFSVGADDYITKPFDVLQVRKTVASLLALRD
jgi:two-component system aerobic respiration control protein ArcA